MKKNWSSLLFFPILLVLLCAGGCISGAHKVQMISTPPGAVVYLNDQEIGTTPFEATIEEREGDFSIYEFYAIKEDYLPKRKAYKEEFYYSKVSDAVPETVNFILEPRKDHRVRITSEPFGAAIILEGVEYGKTPHTLIIKQSLEEPKTYRILARKEGYKDAAKTIKEVASKTEKGGFDLPGEINFVLVKEN